jgi:PiT family inorganic phosphate transporter
MGLMLLFTVVSLALIFCFINGFHDTANAIATIVSTGVLRPRTAVWLAAFLNVLGSFYGTAVARTIGSELVEESIVSQSMVLAALSSAIIWNLFTWYFGIPSSSSHALLGGIMGAALAIAGPSSLNIDGLQLIAAAFILVPLTGFFASLILMIILYWLVQASSVSRLNQIFRPLQLFSCAYMAWSHGTNDAQKTMGIITMALIAWKAQNHPIEPDWTVSWLPAGSEIPLWTTISCALVMGLGTAAGGWRIIRTMGRKIFKLRPIHGFAAETTAATILQLASYYGFPASTTHCITSTIIGSGATRRLSAVSWGLTGRIFKIWLLTIPACAGLSGSLQFLLRNLGW